MSWVSFRSLRVTTRFALRILWLLATLPLRLYFLGVTLVLILFAMLMGDIDSDDLLGLGEQALDEAFRT